MNRIQGPFRVCALILLWSLGTSADPLVAQSATRPSDPAISLSGELGPLVANVGLSALVSVVIGQARGGSLWRELAGGSAGGALGYLGKRIGAARFGGAGLMGREVAAVGSSLTRAAAFGSGLLDTLVMPIGPLRLYWVTDEPGSSVLRLDLEETIWAAYGFGSRRLDFDLVRSLSAGAFVFTSPGNIRGSDDPASGRALSGTIMLRADSADARPTIFAHERVHIGQIDALEIALGLPTERWLMGVLGIGGSSLFRHVDLGVGHFPFQYAIGGPVWSRARNILEIEAGYFEEHR